MDERTAFEGSAWREQLLVTLIHWSTLFGGVIAIGVTLRALFFDFADVRDPAFIAMLVGYGGIAVLRFLPSLSYRVRATALLSATFIAASSAVFLRGLAAAPVLLLGLNVLIAGLFLGRTGLLSILLLVGAVVGIAGRPEPVDTFNAWSSAVDVVCVAGVLTVLVRFVVQRLERSLEHSAQALERLRAEQALRERAQEELTRAQATLQQTQKLDAVGRLAGGVAHDFNNTLQVVLGWTELLRSEKEPEQMQDGIEQIRAAAERSRGLTRQLLTFSRPEMCAPARIELHEFLPALVKSYRRILPDDISIVAHTTPGLTILMDEGHLSQVMLNLVLNARDAMPTGGTVAMIAKSASREELPPATTGFDDGAVEIEVTDTGTGMDEETKSRAFEPFFTTKGKRGTGLGLSTVYGVVQQAHGAIDIQSAPGKGTSVKLLFPPSSHAVAILPGRESRTVRPAVGQAVLLAEDDRDVRVTLARALRQAGHRVVEVGDVEAGRVVVRERGAEFAVLVTDGVMPGGSTRQLIDDYLAARPDGRVVVCSGYIDDELSMRDLSARQFEFVPKPFAPSELVSRLETVDLPSR
ncbi:MAG TPA: ATP-binding protein [Vicinamibacterales bacterium]|nr:ATP-binding protein [Vicinamibacterales bacterium]